MQIEAERTVNPADVRATVAEFEENVNTAVVDPQSQLTPTAASAILFELNTQQLPLGTVLNFDLVPAEAEELHHVLTEFYDMIEEASQELQNGWGMIIITQTQPDLRRVDALIYWNEVELSFGFPVLDELGQPITVYQVEEDTEGEAVLDDAGSEVILQGPLYDGDLNPLLDEGGTQLVGPVPAYLVNSEHIYLHQNAEYFHRPGGN
jgi:hypothetical protein